MLGRAGGGPRPSQHGYRLALLLEKTAYRQPEPILIHFRITNLGAASAYVNQRCFVNASDTPPHDREIVVEVTGPTGKRLPCHAQAAPSLPKTDDFVWLAPGQTTDVSPPHDLGAYFDFATPGTYQLRAIYQNVHGPELGLPVFQGEIRSKPVPLTILDRE